MSLLLKQGATAPSHATVAHAPVHFANDTDLLDIAENRLLSAIRAVGVSIEVSHDFDELVRINEQAVAAGTWEPMLRTIHPAHRDLSPENAFWLRGTDSRGRVITVQAAALIDCTKTSFAARLENLSVFHDHPPAEESCRCTSALARNTFGPVSMGLAGWTDPDFRGCRLIYRLHRLLKIEAWHRWRPSWFLSVVDWDMVAAGSHRRHGPMEVDPEPGVAYHMSEVGDLSMHIMRFSPSMFLTDLADQAASLPVSDILPFNGRSRPAAPNVHRPLATVTAGDYRSPAAL
jgi:hypothetical protein